MEISDIPKWLKRAKDNIKHGDLEHFTMDMLHINIKDLLKDSCFYLSAGADITPIVTFKDMIYSYFFCDEHLYTSIQGVENRFNGTLVKVKDRLIQQGFLEIQKFNLDKRFLGISDKRRYGMMRKLENCEISFWRKEDNIYSIVYMNYDNSLAYKDLYLKNNIVPKAICEILPEGGYLRSTEQSECGLFTIEEKKLISPEFVLGNLISIDDRNQYIELQSDIQYFGDYVEQYSHLHKLVLHKRK